MDLFSEEVDLEEDRMDWIGVAVNISMAAEDGLSQAVVVHYSETFVGTVGSADGKYWAAEES